MLLKSVLARCRPRAPVPLRGAFSFSSSASSTAPSLLLRAALPRLAYGGGYTSLSPLGRALLRGARVRGGGGASTGASTRRGLCTGLRPAAAAEGAKQGGRSTLGIVLKGGVVVSLAGGALFAYTNRAHIDGWRNAFMSWYQDEMLDVENDPNAVQIDIPVIERPPMDFKHPYDDYSVVWRWSFTVYRLFFLLSVFTPVAAVAFWSEVRGGAERRAYFIEWLVWGMETAGCTFQKFAQWLSMRPDLIAPDLIEAFTRMQSTAPAHSYAYTRKLVRESFGGKEVEDLFEEFDEKPIASGTVAQVRSEHRWQAY